MAEKNAPQTTTWIKTAWVEDRLDGGTFLVSAYDEATFEAWGEEPDWYVKERKKHPDVREMYVTIPLAAVEALFPSPPTVKAIDTQEVLVDD